MDIARMISLADSFGMHDGSDGWWILGAVVMMLFMGGMMWMMMRGMGGGSAASPPPENPAVKESPVEILDRRLAEGEISAEDYRARREMLADGTAGLDDAREDGSLSAAAAEHGK